MIYINGRFLTQKITGVQRFALEITRILIQVDPSIRIIVPKNCVKEVLLRYGEEFKQALLFRGAGNALIWEQVLLPLYCFKTGCTLLNFCNSAPVFYFKKLVCVHDMSYKVGRNWFSKKMRLYYSVLIPLILRTAKFKVTVSQFSKNQILHYLPFIKASEISVVYNAPSSFFLYDKLPVNARKKQLLFVGSLEPRKNLNRLIEAFLIVKDPDVKLVIVGNINKKIFNVELPMILEEKIEWKTDCSDNDLQKLYLESLVYINPSLYEGFGLPVIEAAHSGCLLLLSNIPIFQEVSEGCAVFFDPNDINSISQAIDSALMLSDQDKRKMIASSYQSVKQFDWMKSALNIYKLVSNS